MSLDLTISILLALFHLVGSYQQQQCMIRRKRKELEVYENGPPYERDCRADCCRWFVTQPAYGMETPEQLLDQFAYEYVWQVTYCPVARLVG